MEYLDEHPVFLIALSVESNFLNAKDETFQSTLIWVELISK